MTWMNWLYAGIWIVEGIFLLLFRYVLKEKPEWYNIFVIWFLGVLTTLNLGFLRG